MSQSLIADDPLYEDPDRVNPFVRAERLLPSVTPLIVFAASAATAIEPAGTVTVEVAVNEPTVKRPMVEEEISAPFICIIEVVACTSAPHEVEGVKGYEPPAPVASSPSHNPAPPVMVVQNAAHVVPVTPLKVIDEVAVSAPTVNLPTVLLEDSNCVVVPKGEVNVLGKIRLLGNESVHVLFADKSCAPALLVI
jgi:hypothetical protein